MQNNTTESGIVEDDQSSAALQTTAILIANPHAGSYLHNKEHIAETISFLQQHGWYVELCLTQAPGEAGRCAREAVDKHVNVVIAVGGDGTIHEVIQELAGSETALGVLPSGTVNVWAREVGIPLDFNGSREILVHGQQRRVDLCKVNERYFLLMAGIGIDGAVTRAVEQKPIKRFGVIGYLLIAAWYGFGHPPFQVSMELKGHIIKFNAIQVIVGNTQLYGGALKYTWRAKCDDGLLDICIVRKRGWFGRITILADFLFRREQRRHWVRYETGKAVKIYTRYPEAIQVDGEPLGFTAKGRPATIFTVEPDALKVIVPQKLPTELFSKQ